MSPLIPGDEEPCCPILLLAPFLRPPLKRRRKKLLQKSGRDEKDFRTVQPQRSVTCGDSEKPNLYNPVRTKLRVLCLSAGRGNFESSP